MPRKRYQAALDANELNYDEMQMKVVEQLDALHSQISKQNPNDEISIGSKLTGIFRRTKKQNNCAQGLYIWGSVGRGKTYLMDIFYDCLPADKKLRLHFHRFMQEVHHQLRDIRTKKIHYYWWQKILKAAPISSA
jgi:cell division protein ZapE